MKPYVCEQCEHIYEPAEGQPEMGIPPGTPFEQLPNEWTCPACNAAKSQFEPAE